MSQILIRLWCVCPAQVAVQEVRRLQRFGVTAGELERYKMALLRDSAQAAEQALSVPSADNLDFIMESLALGHTVLDQRQVWRLPHLPRGENFVSWNGCPSCPGRYPENRLSKGQHSVDAEVKTLAGVELCYSCPLPPMVLLHIPSRVCRAGVVKHDRAITPSVLGHRATSCCSSGRARSRRTR